MEKYVGFVALCSAGYLTPVLLTNELWWWKLPTVFDEFIALFVGMTASLYAHESAHYIAYEQLGFEPEFIWPRMVMAPDQITDMYEKVTTFLSPQVLTLLYLVLLALPISPVTEAIVAWMFLINLSGGVSDILWSVHWFRWPEGTIAMTASDKTGYVAFPKED
jgi:hypothetical protein